MRQSHQNKKIYKKLHGDGIRIKLKNKIKTLTHS